MKGIVFVTANKNKLREAEHILGMKLEGRDVDIDEIQHDDQEKIVEDKARKAYTIIRRPVMVEDTGLYIRAWNGFPGPFTKWFLRALGNEGAVRLLENENDREATARTFVCYFDGKNAMTFMGEIKGTIAREIRGHEGFGFDFFFVPEGRQKTFAEMGMEEKSRISMRMKAFVNLRDYLSGR